MALAPPSPAPGGEVLEVPNYKPFIRCRDVKEAYDRVGQVGKGQFGAVFKYKCREGGQFVALKKVLMKNETEGFPLTALREIKLLKRLKHTNIVSLKEVVHSAATSYNRQLGDIFLVLEYMEYDLGGLLNKGIDFTLPEIKCLSKQLLTGLLHMQNNKILHRDLKVANLLLNSQGVLKIADFGLARAMDKSDRYTLPVCTRWYRPPELLLGQRNYSTNIDVWSAGCIIAEFFTGSPILQGGILNAQSEAENDIDQFLEICKLCGSPTEELFKSLPQYEFMIPKKHYERSLQSKFKEKFKIPNQAGIDLCDSILKLDPSDRASVQKLLDDHAFFWGLPLPCKPEEMRNFGLDCHDYTTNPHAQRIKVPKSKSSTTAPQSIPKKHPQYRPKHQRSQSQPQAAHPQYIPRRPVKRNSSDNQEVTKRPKLED